MHKNNFIKPTSDKFYNKKLKEKKTANTKSKHNPDHRTKNSTKDNYRPHCNDKSKLTNDFNSKANDSGHEDFQKCSSEKTNVKCPKKRIPTNNTKYVHQSSSKSRINWLHYMLLFFLLLTGEQHSSKNITKYSPFPGSTYSTMADSLILFKPNQV